jgi:phosphinothricin acetyltransferase
MAIVVRDATESDLSHINDIYNHYVVESTCTYQYEPSTLEERRAWFAEHDAAHPVTVATRSGEIVGFGSLGWFRTRIGYRHTVENTVYVRHDAHRHGVGRALLDDLIERARRIGHRTIVAGISAEQTASVALHRAVGFEQVALIKQVGFKFDQWLDVMFMQLMLNGPHQ